MSVGAVVVGYFIGVPIVVVLSFCSRQAVLRHVDFATAKVAVVASPGFVKEDFKKFMFEEAARKGDKVLLENRSKFLFVHCSSAHKGALREVLSCPVRVHCTTVLLFASL